MHIYTDQNFLWGSKRFKSLIINIIEVNWAEPKMIFKINGYLLNSIKVLMYHYNTLYFTFNCGQFKTSVHAKHMYDFPGYFIFKYHPLC